MNQMIAKPPGSSAEQQLSRQVELFTEVVAADLMKAQVLTDSPKDKHGFGREREIKHAMQVAKVCADVASALAKLRGASVDIKVRRVGGADPDLIEG